MSENNSYKKRILLFSIIVIGGFAFAFVFLRHVDSSDVKAFVLKKERKDSIISKSLLKEKVDFENIENSSTEKALSGKKSYKITPTIEYGFGINKMIKDIPNYQDLKLIDIDINCWLKKKVNAVYVLSVEDTKGKNIFWESKPIITAKNEDWDNLHFSYNLKPEAINPDYIIKIYPWNKAKEEFYIDDISISYNGSETINSQANVNQTSSTNFFFDFEKTDGLTGIETIKATTAHSGKMACDLTSGREYGPLVIKKISEVSSTPLKKISVSVWIYPLTEHPNAVLTVSIANSKNETVFWDGKGTDNKPFPKNKWTKINTSYNLPFEKINSDDKIQANVWNKGKTDMIIDDMEIVYGEDKERRGEPSTIDANLIYEKRFTSQKNKPPFKTIYFKKQEINNDNSTFITTDKNNSLADFSPNDEYLVGDFIKDKNNLDEIIHIINGKAAMFAYSSSDKQFKYVGNFAKDSLLKYKKESFDSRNNIYKGNYSGTNKNEFLKYNTDWRFDLKLMTQDKGDYTILGNIDFKEYPNDHNPKYYEFVKIVSGNFIDANKSSVIIIMRNCADNNFTGTHCNQFENVPYLPNSTQLYSL